MSKPVSVKIKPSDKKGKKYDAIFVLENGRTKTTSFGAKGFEDYTQHKDKQRRARYIARHRKNENWSAPMTAGALSRWILWGESAALRTNISNYKKRFSLK